MRVGTFSLLAILLSLVAACSDDDGGGGTAPVVDAPPPPAGGRQILGPIFEVPAGTEVFECFRMNADVTEDLFVTASVGYQAHGGHHIMLYYAEGTTPMRDDPHECTDGDMLDARFIGVGTADGVGVTMPPGVALRIPAGARIYAQAHYLNTTPEAIRAQDAVNLTLTTLTPEMQIAGAWTEIALGFDIPARQDYTSVVTCSPPPGQTMNVPWMIPHMHEFGLHFSLEYRAQGEGEPQMLYDSDWEEALRDHFPVIEFEPHKVVAPGDQLITTCSWRNTTDRDILFPREMCATFMVYYPSPDGALWYCDESGNNQNL